MIMQFIHVRFFGLQHPSRKLPSIVLATGLYVNWFTQLYKLARILKLWMGQVSL